MSTTHTLVVTAFPSALDGRPLLQFSLDGYLDAYVARAEFEGIDEDSEIYEDVIVHDAMRSGVDVMLAITGIDPDAIDVAGLNGDFLVDADKAPAWAQGGGRFTVAISDPIPVTLDPDPVPYPVKFERPESDPCQRGTVGCSVDHGTDDGPCETW